MILQIGSQGEQVKVLQDFLQISADGVFGKETQEAVKKWQQQHGLVADGIVGPKTWTAMGIATTDKTEQLAHISPELSMQKHYLPAGEYFDGPTKKEWLFLHHTAGWHKPMEVIDGWAGDDRGPVATEFVIGGQSVKGNDTSHDGELVQAFPTGGYAWHLGIGNTQVHRNSVGIETCSFGKLTMDGYYKEVDKTEQWIPVKKGYLYTYVGTEVNAAQSVQLKQAFRGFLYWHRYSDKQLEVLRELIVYVANRDSIDVRQGLPALVREKGAEAFNLYDRGLVARTPGLWCHANVATNKFDMFPQQELIDMLLSL